MKLVTVFQLLSLLLCAQGVHGGVCGSNTDFASLASQYCDTHSCSNGGIVGYDVNVFGCCCAPAPPVPPACSPGATYGSTVVNANCGDQSCPGGQKVGYDGLCCCETNCTTPYNGLSCQNGGVLTDTCKCACKPGWAGSNCESVACTSGPDSQPCQNGGVPTGAYDCKCSCPSGYAGDYCEKTRCTTGANGQSCQNGGTPTGVLRSQQDQATADCSCSCPRGKGGANCENGLGEWDCSTADGEFVRTNDCTLSNQIVVLGNKKLTITGKEVTHVGAGMTTITAATSKRHFEYSHTSTLTLKWLKLSGADISSAVCFQDLAMHDGCGGSIYGNSGSNAFFVAIMCWFYNNKAGDGGAMYIKGAPNVPNSATLTNCKITNNVATGSHGGGAIFAYGDANVYITGCIFVDNAANTNALYAKKIPASGGSGYVPWEGFGAFTKHWYETGSNGGAIALTGTENLGYPDATLTNVLFKGNKAEFNINQFESTFNTIEYGYGGALYTKKGSITMKHVTFEENGANQLGGAAYFAATTVSMTDVVVQGNSINSDGTFSDGSYQPWPKGAGLYVTDALSKVNILNSAFRANKAFCTISSCANGDKFAGGGMYIEGGVVKVIKSAFDENEAAIYDRSTDNKLLNTGGNDIYAKVEVFIVNTHFKTLDIGPHSNLVNSNMDQVPLAACNAVVCRTQAFSPATGINCKNVDTDKLGVVGFGMICSSCEGGKYLAPPDNSATCLTVPPGSFPTGCVDMANRVECGYVELCQKGHYCPGGDNKNTSCPIESYADDVGSPKCSKVAPGFYLLACSDPENQIGCQNASLCPMGHECINGKKFPCSRGKYAATMGNAFCASCIPGLFNNETGSTGCTECGVGFFSDSSETTECKICPPATTSTKGQTVCLPCSAGEFLNGNDPPVCSGCAPGYYSEAGATQCAFCVPGRYAKLDKEYTKTDGSTMKVSSGCELCVKGKYMTEKGAISAAQCRDCPRGTIGASRGAGAADACQPCQPGKYLNVSGAHSGNNGGNEGHKCRVCSTGQVAKSPGSTTCEPCANGKVADTETNSTCIGCLPGEYLNSNTKTCDQCPAGYHCPKETPVPLECKPGTYATLGASECTNCDLGKYGEGKVRSSCAQCAPGKYQDGKGETSCKKCPLNTFSEKSENTALAECKKCEDLVPNTITVEEGCVAMSSCVCDKQYYRNPTSLTCSSCPNGGACDQPNMTELSLDTRKGYWRYDASDSSFHECLYMWHCVGTVGGNYTVADSGSNAQCAPGHTGALCGACKAGFKMIRLSCTTCDVDSSTTGGMIALNVVVLAGILAYLLKLAKKANEANKSPGSEKAVDSSQSAQAAADGVYMTTLNSKSQIDAMGNESSLSDGQPGDADNLDENSMSAAGDGIYMTGRSMSGSSSSGRAAAQTEPPPNVSDTIKILVSYLQVFSSFNTTMGIPWPDNFSGMIDVSQFINVDFLSVFSNMDTPSFQVCGFVVPYFEQFITHMLIFPCIVAMAYLATGLALLIRPSGKATYKRGRMKVLFTVMFLLYPSIGSKIFRLFKCVSVGDRRFLEADMNIECGVEHHVTYVGVAVFFIFLYVIGIPLFTLFMLRSNREHLHDMASHKHEEIKDELGSLYCQYEEEFWYWELIEMFRKIILTGAIIAIGNGKSIQIIIALLVQFLYILSINRFAPFKEDRDDFVQFIASVQLFFTLLAGLIIKLRVNNSVEGADAAAENDTYGAILIFLNSTVLVTVLFSVFLATPKGRTFYDRHCKKRARRESPKTQVVPLSTAAPSASTKAKDFWDGEGEKTS